MEFENRQPVTKAEQLTNHYLTINSLIMKQKLELNLNSEPNSEDLTSSQTIAKPNVSSSAIAPKVVNNGNVFGTGNWYTFYCGNCGSQLPSKVEKCIGSNPFDKGCGAPVKWS